MPPPMVSDLEKPAPPVILHSWPTHVLALLYLCTQAPGVLVSTSLAGSHRI